MNAETGAYDGFTTFTRADIIHFLKFWEWCSPLPCPYCILRLFTLSFILIEFGKVLIK